MVKLLELHDAPGYISEVKILLTAYGHYMYDQLKLIAGKDTFYRDLEDFPGSKYSPPYGTFILALSNDKLVGCAGIKKYETDTCEMKRMFIDPEYRGQGIGRLLCLDVLRIAKIMNFKTILLDTNNEMEEAVQLYLSCGFKTIPAYCINENDHPVYMEYDLTP